MRYRTGKAALSDVCLDVEGPGLIGLLGPNGAGKSTLMKILTTELLPTSGQVLADGTAIIEQERAYKESLGYLPQSFGLFNELTVSQFLEYMAVLKDTVPRRVSVEEAVRQTGLIEMRTTRIGALSGGQRQRVGIAQAILGSPRLLIMDEPTVGLDPEERISLRNLFSALADTALVLLSTHIIEDLQSVCSSLVILDKGRIRFTGTPEQLIASTRGHVGVFLEADCRPEETLRVTSRIHTANGCQCRAVAKTLPSFARAVEPTLEDAYLYRLSEEVA